MKYPSSKKGVGRGEWGHRWVRALEGNPGPEGWEGCHHEWAASGSKAMFNGDFVK